MHIWHVQAAPVHNDTLVHAISSLAMRNTSVCGPLIQSLFDQTFSRQSNAQGFAQEGRGGEGREGNLAWNLLII